MIRLFALAFVLLAVYVTFNIWEYDSPVLTTSATAVQHADGLFYLEITADPEIVTYICSLGDCGKGFHDRVEALNYWTGLYGLAYNINIVPIPTYSAP